MRRLTFTPKALALALWLRDTTRPIEVTDTQVAVATDMTVDSVRKAFTELMNAGAVTYTFRPVHGSRVVVRHPDHRVWSSYETTLGGRP